MPKKKPKKIKVRYHYTPDPEREKLAYEFLAKDFRKNQDEIMKKVKKDNK